MEIFKLDDGTYDQLQRAVKALERIADTAEEVNEKLDEQVINRLTKKEEVIVEALELEGHDSIARQVRNHGVESLDDTDIGRATYAISANMSRLPDNASEVHSNLLKKQ